VHIPSRAEISEVLAVLGWASHKIEHHPPMKHHAAQSILHGANTDPTQCTMVSESVGHLRQQSKDR
jgi:hypothetical protein